MKKIIALLFLMFFLCSSLRAETIGKVIDYEITEDYRILVEFEYYVDGVKEEYNDIATYFPEDLKGKTKTEIEQIFRDRILKHSEGIIESRYTKTTGKYPVYEVKANYIDEIVDMLDKNMSNFKKITESKEHAEVRVDSDGDKLYDQIWRIKPDGTKTIINISPTAAPNY